MNCERYLDMSRTKMEAHDLDTEGPHCQIDDVNRAAGLYNRAYWLRDSSR